MSQRRLFRTAHEIANAGSQVRTFEAVEEWLFSWLPKNARGYDNREYHFDIWNACPITCLNDTVRRVLSDLAMRYPMLVGQEDGYYWFKGGE